jgi:hypothetical protein
MMGGGVENYRSNLLMSIAGNGSSIPGEEVTTPKASMLGAAFGPASESSPPAAVPPVVPTVSDMQLLMRELDPDGEEDVSKVQSAYSVTQATIALLALTDLPLSVVSWL